MDVGGGLGVNYGADYAADEDSGSINYTLQEYANAVVYAVKDTCDDQQVPHPTLVSESGRAITAHHSVLIVEALGSYGKDEVVADFQPDENDEAVVQRLFETLADVRTTAAFDEDDPQALLSPLLEAYHDAIEQRYTADMLFSLGYLEMEQKALAERLYWTICRQIRRRLPDPNEVVIPTDLAALDGALVDQYLCDFSVFQSILDHWAIGQGFPIMPIHRLREQPVKRAILVDLTCDSDGKVSHYVTAGDDERFLNVHELHASEPYYLGFFLMGAYQDIMGDAHNLFGRVAEAHVYADAEEEDNFWIEKVIGAMPVQDMLAQVQYFPNDLDRRMSEFVRAKIEAGVVRPSQGVEILERYRAFFPRTTYCEPNPPAAS
jgi:arginine decarboxylase